MTWPRQCCVIYMGAYLPLLLVLQGDFEPVHRLRGSGAPQKSLLLTMLDWRTCRRANQRRQQVEPQSLVAATVALAIWLQQALAAATLRTAMALCPASSSSRRRPF